jgi:hypothetical protein
MCRSSSIASWKNGPDVPHKRFNDSFPPASALVLNIDAMSRDNVFMRRFVELKADLMNSGAQNNPNLPGGLRLD